MPFTLQAIAGAAGPLVFKLIDADNGQVIDQDVSNGVAPLDPSLFAGQLTLAGYAASGQTVSGPVTITLTGNGVNFSKVENFAPYSLFGDGNGGTTFGGSSIQPGEYTVGADANGIPQSVPFTLQAIAGAAGPLVFKLIDADNGQVIDQDVSNGVAPLDPSLFAGQLTLAGYAASGQTVSGPVTITLTGNGVNFSKVENFAPYSLFGDGNGGTTFGGSSIQPGEYTVGANANDIPQSVAFTLQAITPESSSLTRGGSATYDAATDFYTLTTAGNQAGTVMSTSRIDLLQNFTISFEAFLGTNDGGADGLAFVIHNDPAGFNAIGEPGSGLAIGGIQNGLAIEFDTYQSAPGISSVAVRTSPLTTLASWTPTAPSARHPSASATSRMASGTA